MYTEFVVQAKCPMFLVTRGQVTLDMLQLNKLILKSLLTYIVGSKNQDFYRAVVEMHG